LLHIFDLKILYKDMQINSCLVDIYSYIHSQRIFFLVLFPLVIILFLWLVVFLL